MIFCCSCSFETGLELSDFADLSQVIIAVINLFLAFYLLVYEKRKDSKNDNQASLLNKQNIRLQWFKDLIIQPNISKVNDFYDNLFLLKNRVQVTTFTQSEKIVVNNEVKDGMASLRKSFIDIITPIDRPLSNDLLANVDDLVDKITEALFNTSINLCVDSEYERHIENRISNSKNTFIAKLFSYEGL